MWYLYLVSSSLLALASASASMRLSLARSTRLLYQRW